MHEVGADHPLTYRQTLVAQVFDLLQAGESIAIIGSASMGKSRLVQFLLRSDVLEHYLGDEAKTSWLVLADCNRLAEVSAWGLHELLLTALTETVPNDFSLELRHWLNDLRREAISCSSPLLAKRHLELATRVLTYQYGLRLCFMLDEFDLAYRSLPANALVGLRALRDACRYSICYAVVMRDHPARLREPSDHEGFYELLSRSVFGLGPYTLADAQLVLNQLASRHRYVLVPELEQTILWLSGGHPGLIVGLYDILMHATSPTMVGNSPDWALGHSHILEECAKLWKGLALDEQLAMSHIGQGIGIALEIRELLLLKGLLKWNREKELVIFSPIVDRYVATHGDVDARCLWIDETAAVVWVERRRIADLSPLEYSLLRFLYRQLGKVCSRDEITTELYPDEHDDGTDARIDSLVSHLRKAIEPSPTHPRYLLTVRGRGFKLVDRPSS